MMAYCIEEGAYYCRGGSQRLADAFAAGLAASGGELLLGTRAERILVTGQRVRGVVLENGQQIRAPVAISNIDARHTFGTLVGSNHLPARFRRRVQQMKPSVTVRALYLGTDLDAAALGAAHEMDVYTSWDLDRVYGDGLAGQVPALSMVVPTLSDPSLAPPGEHAVILHAFAPHDASDDPYLEEGRFAERMMDLAEQVLPGLREHITFVHGPGSGMSQRFPLHRLGPIYGWAASPEQAGMRRLPHRTPMTGLFLVGHWTQPAHGIVSVVESGVRVTRLVLGLAPRSDVLPLALPEPARAV